MLIKSITVLILPSSIRPIYTSPKISHVGAPPVAPPFEKNMVGRKTKTTMTDSTILARFREFFLKE